jgi:hypothetical protein
MVTTIPSPTDNFGAADGAPGMVTTIPSASNRLGAEDGAF